MATNLRPLARKLQTALYIQRGRRISINQYQMYSAKAGRTVTKYVLSEGTQTEDGRNQYKTLLSSWSLPDVVKFMAGELQRNDNNDTMRGGAADGG